MADCGGGTLNFATYECTNEAPLRLSTEVVAPESK
jgi:hypothetical protein